MDCWPPWAPLLLLGLASHSMGNVSWKQRLIQRLSDSYKHSSSGAEGFVSGHLNRSSSTQRCCQNHSSIITCVPHICRLALNLNRTFLLHFVFCVYTVPLTSLSWLSMKPGERSLCIKRLRAWQPRSRGSLPGRSKNYIFTKEFEPALMPTPPPIRRVSWALWSRLTRPRRAADSWQQFSAKIKN
jgi:hypothetical protein